MELDELSAWIHQASIGELVLVIELLQVELGDRGHHNARLLLEQAADEVERHPRGDGGDLHQ